MANTVVKQSEVVGNVKSKTMLVEQIARWNSLNRTGKINYNEGGIKDDVGLQSVTEKFVDNFLLRVLVADYNTKGGKNIYIGTQNKAIRDLLSAYELNKCIVKAIAFKKLRQTPTKEELEKMPMRNLAKKADVYYYQDYKVACPNVEYAKAINFLRTADLATIGMVVKDFDVTMDYAGSFDKAEVIDHLVTKLGFSVQGQKCNTLQTIVDNDASVGRNCLTYMETTGDIFTRKKVYNKMVQMLECKSVRNSVGCHWKDWVCQQGTRLADARDKTKYRGLTRAEVTFYIDGSIPTDLFIEESLQSIVARIPTMLIYSTPFAKVWSSYCASFQHSLVCVDRSKDIGLIVYSYNEITQNISGESYEKWSEREKWCLDKLTLNGNLPLDIIDINVTTDTYSSKRGKVRKDSLIEIAGSRYFKIHPDSSTTFQTRLVSNKGVYCHNKDSSYNNCRLLENAGFVVHENCIPYLASIMASAKSKANAELRKIENLEIRVEVGREKKRNNPINDVMLHEEAAHLEKMRKPLLVELRLQEIKQRTVNDYKKKFTTRASIYCESWNRESTRCMQRESKVQGLETRTSY